MIRIIKSIGTNGTGSMSGAGVSIASDNRTATFNYTNNSDRADTFILHPVPINNKIVIEDTINYLPSYSIPTYNDIERMDVDLMKGLSNMAHSANSSTGRGIRYSHTLLVIAGNGPQIWNYQQTDYQRIGTPTYGSNTNDVSDNITRGYCYDFINNKWSLYRNGVLAVTWDMTTSSYYMWARQRATCLFFMKSIAGEAHVTVKINLGESGLKYSYPGFTPLGQIEPVVLSSPKLFLF